MVLTEEEDVLEAEWKLLLPPGRSFCDGLLSTSDDYDGVALLFHFIRLSPAVCVLDELDAPLDDANIDRYVQKLKEFLAHSQFIVITHSKRTISAADVIYGVTMQERGVSRMVSVKFSADQAGASNANRISQYDSKVEMAPNGDEEIFLAK